MQEEFQEGKWSDTSSYNFVVKFALLCSLDNFCQHCYSELTPTTSGKIISGCNSYTYMSLQLS